MSWKLYRKSVDAWGAMLEDVRSATTTIDLEQYILVHDEIGTQFLNLFIKKAKQGVRIRILCDAMGSIDLMDDPIVETLLEAGVEIRFYNPIKPWRVHNISSWFLRDHRKILIIDRRVAHVGGVGIEERMRNWRDTHVRLEDEVVQDIENSFFKMWELARKRRVKFFKKQQASSDNFVWLSNAPRFRARFIYHTLVRAIRRARKYIYLTAPYIVPSVRLANAIRRARRRGVDVRILVPKESDVPIVDIAGGSYYLLFLKWGVRIFQYGPLNDVERASHLAQAPAERAPSGGGPEILHAKTVVIDGEWAMMGSSNLDNLSLVFNFEGNVATADPQFIEEIKTDFLEDIARSHELSRDEWIKRPFLRKVFEVLTWPIHGIL